MHRTIDRLALALLAAITAMPSFAQSTGAAGVSHRRQGFYISGGLGYGTATVKFSDPTVGSASQDNSGLTTYLALGGSLSPRVRLGAEFNTIGSDVGNGVTQTVGFFTAAVAYYPSATNNFWLKGNVGLGLVEYSGGGSTSSASAFAVGVGFGYDWYPSTSRFAIIPFASYFLPLSSGVLSNQAGGSVSAKGNLVQFGIGVGYKH